MKVRYTPEARADLKEIHAFLKKDNPAAARRVRDEIREVALADVLEGRRMEPSDDRQVRDDRPGGHGADAHQHSPSGQRDGPGHATSKQ